MKNLRESQPYNQPQNEVQYFRTKKSVCLGAPNIASS